MRNDTSKERQDWSISLKQTLTAKSYRYIHMKSDRSVLPFFWRVIAHVHDSYIQNGLQHFCCSNWADLSTGGVLTPQQQ